MVNQGCVNGAIYPVVQRVAQPSVPGPKRAYRYKSKSGKTCEVCGGKVPPGRHPNAETCCDECSAELHRIKSRESMRRMRKLARTGGGA